MRQDGCSRQAGAALEASEPAGCLLPLFSGSPVRQGPDFKAAEEWGAGAALAEEEQQR